LRFALSLIAGVIVLGAGFKAAASLAPDAPPMSLSYRMTPGQEQRYKLTADIKASVPIFGSPTPTDLEAGIELVYIAKPKTQLADGLSDVDLEVEKASLSIGMPGSKPEDRLPFPLELDQIREVLNQQVTISKLGEVVKVRGGGEVPFGVSIPGVDPKRLYALLFPVVFKAQPVKAGDKWTFTSELLGGKGTKPNFTATVLPTETGAAAIKINQTFDMMVDNSVTVEKKPVEGGKPAHRRTLGKIEGIGDLRFDPSRGLFTRSVVNIKANIADKLVGKPIDEDEPKEILSKVDARVVVELQPAKAADSGNRS
jgi:hypothetical protein